MKNNTTKPQETQGVSRETKEIASAIANSGFNEAMKELAEEGANKLKEIKKRNMKGRSAIDVLKRMKHMIDALETAKTGTPEEIETLKKIQKNMVIRWVGMDLEMM